MAIVKTARTSHGDRIGTDHASHWLVKVDAQSRDAGAAVIDLGYRLDAQIRIEGLGRHAQRTDHQHRVEVVAGDGWVD